MAGRIYQLARPLGRYGLWRGLFRGSDIWLLVGSVAMIVRVLGRPKPPAVEQLRASKSIVVTHLPPPESRRALRRAARSDGRA